LYIVAPDLSFPGNSITATLPVQHNTTVTLSNWPPGGFVAEWYSPTAGTSLGLSRGAATNGNLALSLPDFTEDLAGIVYSPPRFETLGCSVSNGFQTLFSSETGGRYEIQRSFDLSTWNSFLTVTNTTGSMLVDAPFYTNSRSFFRAQKLN
jgi:hypothetical protein